MVLTIFVKYSMDINGGLFVNKFIADVIKILKSLHILITFKHET